MPLPCLIPFQISSEPLDSASVKIQAKYIKTSAGISSIALMGEIIRAQEEVAVW